MLLPSPPHRTCVIADIAHVDDLAAVLAVLPMAAEAGANAIKINAAVLAADPAGTLLAASRAAALMIVSEPGDTATVPLSAWLATAPADITHGALLLEIARSHKPILLGVAGATQAEVRDALGVIAFGYVAPPDAAAHPRAFRDAYKSSVGKAALADKVALVETALHLPALSSLMQIFDLPVGWIDTTDGAAIAAAAVGCGARLIAKTWTTAPAFAAYVAGLREVDATFETAPAVARAPRPHLVALAPIALGESFTPQNLGARRSRAGAGLSPMALWSYFGKTATRAYHADDAIEASS